MVFGQKGNRSHDAGMFHVSLRPLLWLCGPLAAAMTAASAAPPLRYEATPHHYWESPLQDAFSRWWRENSSTLDSWPPAASEQEALRRVLAALQLPESSQMLVFSATSLQRTIGPHRPRALYFNDEIYLGWVPGGRLEIAADDPVVGPVFFILSLTQSGRLGEPDRQTRCLNCHGNADTGNLPALLATSVLPDEDGGSLETFRPPGTGHHVPLASRFGGWHLSDTLAAAAPLANRIGRSAEGRTNTIINLPGNRFPLENYLRPTSTLLPQLIHEHQLGAVNLMTAALYRAREIQKPGNPPLTAIEESELNTHATNLARYFLFADEATLPPDGIPRDPAYARDFTANRRPDAQGRSLKDLDLRTRLFTHRGSYMLYTPLWKNLPALVKNRVWRALSNALQDTPSPDGTHLAPTERRALREIIHTTCDDRPEWWQP
jgi:hypothetical protein